MNREIKKILLIQPNMTIVSSGQAIVYPPLGIMYLASVLEERGCEVSILDCQSESCGNARNINGVVKIGLPMEEIAKRIRDFAPDCVGVSCNFSVMLEPMNETVRMVREIAPETLIVVGGHHPTSLPEEVMDERAIDFVIMGEGEQSLPALLDAVQNGSSLAEVGGLAWRDPEVKGHVNINPPGPFIEDLDAIPYPAWHLFPYEKYSQDYKPHDVQWGNAEAMPSLLTTRGCAAKCIFCSVYNTMGRRFRARALEEVFKEIDFLIEEYHIKKLIIVDDNFTHNKKRTKDFCDEFKRRGYDLEIHFMVLALWCMDEELIDKLNDIGYTSMAFAMESGVQNTVTNIIKKPLDIRRSMELLRYAKSKGMKITATFVVGFPGETKKDIRRTLYMANYSGLFDNREICIATPLPGTELFAQCVEGDYFVDGFSYANMEVVKPNIETEEFSAKFIEIIVEADRTHHLIKTNPSRLIHFLGDVRKRKPHIFLNVLFETAKMFLKYDFLKFKEKYP